MKRSGEFLLSCFRQRNILLIGHKLYFDHQPRIRLLVNVGVEGRASSKLEQLRRKSSSHCKVGWWYHLLLGGMFWISSRCIFNKTNSLISAIKLLFMIHSELFLLPQVITEVQIQTKLLVMQYSLLFYKKRRNKICQCTKFPLTDLIDFYWFAWLFEISALWSLSRNLKYKECYGNSDLL